MNARKTKLLAALTLSLPLLCSCINTEYNLANIDTTTRVEVKDLVVPLKLEDISLDKIMDLDSVSKLKEVIDPATGQKVYAVVTDGTFESGGISVPSFTATKPTIKPITSSVSLEKLNKELDQKLTNVKEAAYNAYISAGLTAAQAKALVQQNEATYKKEVWEAAKSELGSKSIALYSFAAKSTSFDCKSGNVDKAVRQLSELKVKLGISTKLSISNLEGIIDNVTLKNFKIQLPKGLTLTSSKGKYDKATGILDIPEAIQVSGNQEVATLEVTAIDAPAAGITLTTKDNANGSLSFKGDVTIVAGDVEVTCGDFASGKTFFDLPASISYSCQPTFSDVTVEKMSGEIKYDIKNVNVNPVVLSDIPEFISGNKTNLVLSNPQIYLKVNNPVEKYGIYAQTGMNLYGIKGKDKRQAYQLDDQVIKMAEKENVFCLAPTNPAKYYTGYEKAKFAKFTGLKNIVSGDGLPTSVSIDLVEPCVPQQKVTDLELGTVIDKVVGNYTFYAPINIENGSVIVYSKTADGWGGDTDKLAITGIKINATVSSELPLDATLNLTAIDTKGKDIAATFNEAHLEANASNQSFVFEQLSGTIKNLNGVRFTVTVVGKDAAKTLAPVQTISVKDLKVTVSGYYEDQF